uniref:Uncharacterized protein n=1 Tax=Vespula pensylvanica TaxID=30213 RepID=A0A834NYN8_VESPE|nr:hypothetical protein H0235_009483 [Vespula pensylvanica]
MSGENAMGRKKYLPTPRNFQPVTTNVPKLLLCAKLRALTESQTIPQVALSLPSFPDFTGDFENQNMRIVGAVVTLLGSSNHKFEHTQALLLDHYRRLLQWNLPIMVAPFSLIALGRYRIIYKDNQLIILCPSLEDRIPNCEEEQTVRLVERTPTNADERLNDGLLVERSPFHPERTVKRRFLRQHAGGCVRSVPLAACNLVLELKANR